jgi:hypothetical protein
MVLNKYAVILSSLVDGATVRIQFLVNSEMNAQQLATYYKCKSVTISDVEILGYVNHT